MSKTTIIAGVIILLLAAGGILFYLRNKTAAPVIPPAEVATSTTETYASTTLGVSLQYPTGYTLNESYTYSLFGPNKLIHGVSFTIPATMATGTNLATDTYVSVEQLPHAKNCTGDIFLPANVTAQTVTEGSVEYSLASSTGAAAGNRYEEWVYALVGSQPCTAVRYFIHYGVIENYPPGMVQAFDHTALINQFDAIRRSLVLAQ